MAAFSKVIQIRWSDLDPNFHLRHSVYYDWGAMCRVDFLNEHQLTAQVMQQLRVGPILFKEECTFRREIKLGDDVRIDLKMTKARKDHSRWSIQHQITKEDTVCAVLNVDGAWMNIVERKLCTPPEQVLAVFNAMPKHDDFQWI